MSKKLVSLPKKRTLIIILTCIALVGIGVGGYYYLSAQKKQQEQQAVEQKKALDTERTKLDDTAFRGDRDLAAEYMLHIQNGEPKKALDTYESAVQKAPDDKAKFALYNQAVTIAYRAKQTDQAIDFAIKASDIANNYRASSNVADLYGLKKDYENQKKYLQKALDQVETLPKDSEEYASMKAFYQDKLSKVGTN